MPPVGFDSLPIFAEFLLINSTDEYAYDEFLNPYNFNVSLQLTPFDTEFSQSYKNIAIELNLSTLESFASDGYIDFSHIIFSVPYPTHELTIDQIVNIEQFQDLADYIEYFDNRVWQYTEVELLTSGEDFKVQSSIIKLDKTIFFNSMIQDITERKNVESMIKEKIEKLKEYLKKCLNFC